MGNTIMKILLRIHNLLYTIINSWAVRANAGVHPKHKLMNYHRFFAKRLKTGESVLDIGCGMGELTRKLESAKKVKVLGVDNDKSHLDEAIRRTKNKNISFLYADATKHKFNKKFDAIVLSNVLEHIKERKQFLKAIKPLAKRILIRVPLIDRDWLTLYKEQLGIDYRLDPTHYIEYTYETFEAELKSAGLKIKEHEIRYGEIYATVS